MWHGCIGCARAGLGRVAGLRVASVYAGCGMVWDVGGGLVWVAQGVQHGGGRFCCGSWSHKYVRLLAGMAGLDKVSSARFRSREVCFYI